MMKVIALALVFCLSIVLANLSLRFIPVSFNQARHSLAEQTARCEQFRMPSTDRAVVHTICEYMPTWLAAFGLVGSWRSHFTQAQQSCRVFVEELHGTCVPPFLPASSTILTATPLIAGYRSDNAGLHSHLRVSDARAH